MSNLVYMFAAQLIFIAMTFAFLPNYFKKIGIACFITAIGIIIIAAVMTALETESLYKSGEGYSNSYLLGYKIGFEFTQKNKWVIQTGSILLMLSITFYMLAKEKVDDEYLDAIRWESLRLSIIVSIIIIIIFTVLSWKLYAKPILLIQFITYLITFKIKKSGK